MRGNPDREPLMIRGFVQEAVIIALAGSDEPLTVAELTERTDMGSGQVNQALVNMRTPWGQGIVTYERETGPHDRKSNHYRINETAKDDLVSYLEEKAALIAQALKTLRGE